MKQFVKSLLYALHGCKLFFSKEKNGSIQAVIALLVTAGGFIYKVTRLEWIVIINCIAFVLCLEMINSAIEKLLDHLHPQQHNTIKWIKDVAAAAVLFAAIVSAIAGAIIFLPKIFT